MLWAVYDETGDCVGVDVMADDELGALAQFTYSDDRWTAKPSIDARQAQIAVARIVALLNDPAKPDWDADAIADAVAEWRNR